MSGVLHRRNQECNNEPSDHKEEEVCIDHKVLESHAIVQRSHPSPMNECRLVSIFLRLTPNQSIDWRKYRHDQIQAKPEEGHSITEIFLWPFKQLDKEVQMEEQVACQEESIVYSEVEEHQHSSEHPHKHPVFRVLNPSSDSGIEEEIEKPYHDVTFDELPAVDGR